MKRGSKKGKGRVSKAAIGAPVETAPTAPPAPAPTPTMPSAPTTSTPSSPNGEFKPFYDRKDFTPEGIPDDDEWHQPDPSKPYIMEHQMNATISPLDVVRFWAQNDGARLKNAQPFDPQHGDYDVFDGPPGLLQSEKYKKAQREGPGYEGDVGQPAPKSKPKKKPSGDQHAKGSYSAGSVEGVRYSPGSFASGVTNGMTNRDKYVR